MGAEPSDQVNKEPTVIAHASLFGEFRLSDCNGTEISLSNRRARALLAILCLEPNQPIVREQITRLLWSGRFEAQAKASLRQCLLEMSKTLEPLGYPLLMVTRERIAINGPNLRTDLADLEQALTYGQYEEAVQALTLIGANRLLDDLHLGDAFTDWLAARREQTSLRLQASVNLALDDLEQRAEHVMRRRLLTAWAACAPLASSRIVRNWSDGKTRIAVLPFQALGSADAGDYFTDGLVDELITTLGQVPQMLVAGRTSSFHFRDSDLSPAQIAAELGVSHLIEGSVQRHGEQIRVHVRLLDGATGFELSGARYDGTLDAIFRLQESVAQAVTGALAEALNLFMPKPYVRQMTDCKEAYDLYLQGRALSFRLFGDGSLDTAVALLGKRYLSTPILPKHGFCLPKCIS